MSSQKQRRNFRNSKNNKEHKLKERKDELQEEEEKLETLRQEFSICLKKLTEYEESNIFSRDDDNTISNFLIENKILSKILIEYKKLINEEKENYWLVQGRFASIVGEINENAMNLNNLLTDIEIFYAEMNTEFANEEKFRNKLIEKLNKLNDEMKILSPLISGKNIECVLKIANQLSLIYSSIQLEKKQYSKIKKELKKHQHHTLTHTTKGIDNNNNNNYNELKINDSDDNDSDSDDENISKYKMTDLKQIENEIRKLRKKKCETMKKLIDKVYGKKYKKNNLKELKLKQVLLHYNDSIIDDNKMHLKLEYELLEIQCEEFQNELMLLEKKKEINQAKKVQLSNAINIYNNQNENENDFHQISSKQISRQALTQLHKLQKLEREQRKAIHLIEKEILKIEKSIKEEKAKQKSIKNKNFHKQIKAKKEKKMNKKKREISIDLDDDDDDYNKQLQEIAKYKKERKELERQFNKNNELIEEKRKYLNNLNKESEATLLNKSELQKMSHQYKNSIVSNRYLSQNAVRKNSESLEFMAEINFMNTEYELQMQQINNKYREKQTFLKNKFISDFNHKIKKNSKNRQTQIEQESYNIIQERKDKELIDLTQVINDQLLVNQNKQDNLTSQSQQSVKFCNKSKAVKIKFANQTIVSSSINELEINHVLQNDVLRAIKFEWNDDKSQHEQQENEEMEHNISSDDITDIEQDDISTDLSFDDDIQQQEQEHEHDDNVTNYKNLISQMDNGNIDIYNFLNKQMNSDENLNYDLEHNDNHNDSSNDNQSDDIGEQHLKFDNINMVKELLVNWTFLTQSNVVK